MNKQTVLLHIVIAAKYEDCLLDLQVHAARSYPFVKEELVVKLCDMPKTDYDQCRQVGSSWLVPVVTLMTGLS